MKRTRQEIEHDLLNDIYCEDEPEKYWEVDGEIYFSKDEMPEDILSFVERSGAEGEKLLKRKLNAPKQTKKYMVNDIQYDSLDNMPEIVRSVAEELLKNCDVSEKYTLYHWQTKKYAVNGVQYDTLEEMPEQIRKFTENWIEKNGPQVRYSLSSNFEKSNVSGILLSGLALFLVLIFNFF